MANVNWSAGIDSVSGALSKPSKSGQHSCNKMLLGTHRVAATTNNNCNRMYIRKKVERSTPVTADEILQRQRFASVSRAVATRAKDLSRMGSDKAAFQEQKDEPGGKKTLKSYLWSLEMATYDQAHQG
jgi:hypothetical protein